jgi:hypothetical protein
MSWGFLWKTRAPKPVTNVRDDQITINPFWRDSFQKRRCLVPAAMPPSPPAAPAAGGPPASLAGGQDKEVGGADAWSWVERRAGSVSVLHDVRGHRSLDPIFPPNPICSA